MGVDLQRRKAVMGRSIKLGKCVCNPLKPCPCPEFREHNVCACAGEKMPQPTGPVALTRHVRKAGCASKIGQANLLRILGNLPPVDDPNVLVGMAAGDDAGVYRLSDGRCLVQTVDVFTPCVDDAYLFGQIAAANSLSDCYAMGAKPLTALSVMCFPIETLDGEQMRQMLLGGMDKLREAGCALLGGHSVNDEEVKCGFAITGLLENESAVERGKAQAGDALVLTKPLGTGVLSFAAQMGRLSAGWQNEVGRSMATLNKDAAELMVQHGAHACTDVTGFGLAGHLIEMARGSGVCAEVTLERLPVFAPVADCIQQGVFGGAVEKNMEYAMGWVHGSESDNNVILFDPQTSGGLLIALPQEKSEALVNDLHKRGHDATAVIGRVTTPNAERAAGTLWVCGDALENLIGESAGGLLPAAPENKTKTGEQKMTENVSCCAGGNAEPAASCCSGTAAPDSAAPALFMDFMKSANAPGALDAKTKKLLAIALSVTQKCDPCLRVHLNAAVKMGITRAEIDEAAWMGIAFGGAPCMMFYQAISKEVWE
ncbi:TPA: selenide, water dikinase SelD [Candidatus Sumerlaeota bacterium]|nr:selenide, water dikinase SelD [Candidatus Sumerlaeota bacterium]